jgi:GNAT superfamily N-acetyltransferase
MHGIELSQLEISTVRTDADLEDMIRVQALVRPDWQPKLENLRHHLESNPDLTYFVGRLGREPVACGFLEPWGPLSQGDVAVVPAGRRRGIGSALFCEISSRARKLGRDEIQGEVQESDTESRAFFERRGFIPVGGEKAVVLELDGVEPPDLAPPEGVRIVTRAEEPDRLDEMYTLAVQADEDIPGSAGEQSYERWRAMDIDRPNCLPELCFVALAGNEVVGYAFLQASGERAFHGLTVTRRDWRRRGVATALKRAEIAAAKRAGFKRLLTESEERNEPMRRLNEKLGFVPAPEWSTVVMRGPLA